MARQPYATTWASEELHHGGAPTWGTETMIASREPCHYHPEAPAIWRCRPCGHSYCNQCIPLNDDKPLETPRCPLCGLRLDFLGTGHEAQPFWKRLNFFCRYPLQKGPLLLYTLLFIAGFLASTSIIFSILYLCVVLKYLQSVLENNSKNIEQAPDIIMALSPEGFALFFYMTGMLITAGLTGAVAHLLMGYTGLAIAAFALTVALPASLIILNKESALLPAISPANILALVLNIGAPYFILYAALTLSLALFAGIFYGLWLYLPLYAILPPLGPLFCACLIGVTAMLGCATYQYRDQLGYAGDISQERPAGYPQDRWEQLHALASARIQAEEGRETASLNQVEDMLYKYPDSPELHKGYHDLLMQLGQSNLCLLHAQEWLPQAARLNAAATLPILRDAWQLQPDFSPDDPHTRHALARALASRSPKGALFLLHNLHKRFPDYPELASAYLLAARCYMDGLAKPEPARQLLHFIAEQHPDSHIMEEVHNRLALLDKVSGSPPLA